MSPASNHALSLARPTVVGLMIVNAFYAASISILLAYSFFIPGWPENPLGGMMIERFPHAGTGLRLIVAIGIACAVIVHIALRRLFAIIETVRAGDPFTFDNAQRLKLIAWSALALELLRLSAIAIAKYAFAPFKIAFASWAFGAWLAVLLLFVLSGVFAQGARMRADLEGTV